MHLPELPDRIAALPRDSRGYPVPWFVAWVDGKPLFPVMDPPKLAQAVSRHLCWVCGQPLGRFLAFVIGPMCSINRVSAEPPSHLDCAVFSAQACPFLTRPAMKRMDLGELPTHQPPGHMIERNPGCVCIWVTRSFRVMRRSHGVLFRLGEPTDVRWFREGRPATRAEVLESIDSGLPLLEEVSLAQDGAPEALAKATREALRLIPKGGQDGR